MDVKFNYMLLNRLQEDCEYYIKHPGKGAARQLWAGDEQKQIDKMRELWNSFAEDAKPQWLTMEQIDEYAKKMGVK